MPGQLSKAHAPLEKASGCLKCHEPDKTIVAARCLVCHAEVGRRIAAKKGVHRDVIDRCLPCHVEHAGRDVDLRPIDPRKFDHAGRTGFALEGRHAAIAPTCSKCHKTRSFLTASPACASCHEDKHKGRLGTDCERCHTPRVPFVETRRAFDHGKAPFVLTGAHLTVKCELCHKEKTYRGLRFASCGDCHKDPHDRPLGKCESCHQTNGFRKGFVPGMVDHSRTAFPLAGGHAKVPCASCHGPAFPRPRSKAPPCTVCHAQPHGRSLRDECGTCHRETGRTAPPFDHRARTRFPLEGKHAALPCTRCHKPSPAVRVAEGAKRPVEFQGLSASCASCHADSHRGRLGTACEKCHDPRSFRLGSFRHPRFPEFFVGRHAAGACEKCHRPVPAGETRRFKGTSLACGTCHTDPHLGQVGSSCKPCHAPDALKFQVVGFDHSRSRFPLDGRHAAIPCDRCHKREEGAFPAGRGSAVRLTEVPRDCVSCHRDVHGGKLGEKCGKCHSAVTFALPKYVHADERGAGGARRTCVSCHRPAYEKSHEPPHAAAGLGTDCESCHRLEDPSWALGTYPHATWKLRGSHQDASCSRCHTGGVFRGLPVTCVSCHLDDYQRALRPNHAAGGLSTECEPCHGVADTTWRRATPKPG